MFPIPGRNAPCPCGSGLKYKKCCGQSPLQFTAPDPLLLLARNFRKHGRPSQALGALAQILRRHPRHIDALLLKAEIEAEQGNVNAAILILKHALRVDPAHFAAHYNLATLLKYHGQPELALTWFEKAIALHPQDADTYNNYGNTLAALGRHEDAIRAYRKAIQFQAKLTQAYQNLGAELQHRGDFAGAAATYQQALVECGESAACYRGLSATRRFGPDDQPLITQIETYAARLTLNVNERAEIEFALGKIYDDLKDYPAAFQHYTAGNRTVRDTLEFHLDQDVLRAERILQTFTPDTLRAATQWGHTDDRPIIIMGMPRSGTSLIEQIVASHPVVQGAGELDFWRDEDLRLFPNYLQKLPQEAHNIASRYIGLLDSLSPNTQRITDKLPGNFWHVGLIHSLFPHAHLIHCRRNPVDTCLSIYFQKFAGDHPYAYDLQELADYYRLYRRLTRYWKRVIPADRYTEISYEDLIAAPESESRRLIEFCGLDWNPKCLDFHLHARQVKTASSWQVRQPIYHSSRERWRNYAAYIEPLIGLLDEDDSPTSTPTRPLPRAA